ncbi:uncharacterized protein EKO05_0003553 [Ascochyta rabiei]|uniref:Uncharacterized protein n=1 Tax=Didymella rabiei TaxID=5454 RepID=A0A163ABG7_DIDRA|nr:uncharacterized protein EKO05_0003553 [Ascochyta rabiei]KZM21096.1 hypothetical protein ST47_g7784 [Ascochyta rabiei]UPX13024.1 hypothetical protein EKO05_0003553 [Ascochyta rabiei]
MAFDYASKDSCDATETQPLLVKSLDVSAVTISEHRDSLLAIDDDMASTGVGKSDLKHHAGVGGLASGQESLSFAPELALTEQTIKYAETPCKSYTGDVAHEGIIEVLYQALISNSKHAFPPATDHFTTVLDRPMFDIDIDNDVRELQEATAAFLADQYDDGEFVATPGDIVDLEVATTAFLAGRYDGELFRMEGPGSGCGLLLPDKQSLIPTSKAVDIARATFNSTKDNVEMIDEYLGAQPSCGNEPNTPLLDAASMVDVSQNDSTSFYDRMSLELRPDTPQLDECSNPPLTCEFPSATRSYPPDLSGHLYQHPDFCDDDDGDEDDDGEFSDIMTDFSDMAFDAPDALSLSQASYAASFFDIETETLVAYTSLDMLLTIDDEEELIPCGHRVLDDEDEIDADGECGIMEIGEGIDDGHVRIIVHLDESWFDCDVPINSPATRSGQHRLLEAVAELPTIFEEDEPSSVTPDSSAVFLNHPGPQGSPLLRRTDLLENGDKGYALLFSKSIPAVVAIPNLAQHLRHPDVEAKAVVDSEQDHGLPQPVSLCSTVLKDKNEFQSSELFADDIWTNGPDLQLAFSDEQTARCEFVDGAAVDLSQFPAAVFEAVQARSSDNVSTSGADLKQKLRSFSHDFRDLDWTERLDKIVDLAMSHTAARSRLGSMLLWNRLHIVRQDPSTIHQDLTL